MMIAGEDDMIAYARDFGLQLQRGDVVALSGSLGAGKTVFCRGILSALGYDGEVTSPSYALVHEYHVPDVAIPVIHSDLYRMQSAAEFEELGLFDAREDCITLIEWAERVEPSIIRARYQITLTMAGEYGREILITKVNDDD